jgi:Flp pilus assembly pilin Flp
MKSVLGKMWKEEDGVLSFEWVLLVTLLTIGIVGGVAAARDAIIDELGDVAQAMLALDQSYTIAMPLLVIVHDTTSTFGSGSGADSQFVDAAIYLDCGRVPAGAVTQEPVQNDTDS